MAKKTVKNKKHVFVDWYEVDPGYGVDLTGYQPLDGSPYGVKIVAHKPFLESTPILEPDKPWDIGRAGMSSVIKINGQYHMWYEAINRTPEWIMLCYATSDDGVNWVKPNLGLVEFQGKKENNIVRMEGKPGMPWVDEGDIVYYDEHAPKNERFKLLFTRVKYSGKVVESVDNYTATSADGIHWKNYRQAFKGGDSFPGLIYLKESGKYVAMTKAQFSNHLIRRTIVAFESPDFINWNQGTILLNGSMNDKPDTDYYTSPFWAWPGTGETAFVMMPSIFHRTEDTVKPVIAFSRDLNTWTIPHENMPLINQETDGYMGHYVSFGFVAEDNKYIHYLTKFKGGHNGGGFGTEGKPGTWRMIYREDGYTSLYAESHGGFTTIPLNVGKGLILNADIGLKAYIKVAITNEENTPYEGFGFDDCKVEPIDELRYRVTWAKDMAELPSKKNHRFKFKMFRAHLYSYTCLDCESYENEDGDCPYRIA
ncbi:MAG: hypothetical protein ACOX3K_02165 [Bacilli bacterium]|jgi:hypothetical protein